MSEGVQFNSDAGMWMVRAGRGGEFAARFLKKSIVAIGWGFIGEIDAQTPDAEIRRMMDEFYPREKTGARAAWTSAVRRFVKEVAIGDPVVTYDNEGRMYHLGEIRSDAKRGADGVDGGERWEFYREVAWQDETPRDSLLLDARNNLARPPTLFRVSAAASAELRRRASKAPAPPAATDGEPQPEPQSSEPPVMESDESETIQEYIEKSDQFIEDAIAKLDWEQLQELTAGILRAMGYKTTVASRGPDRGVDISASPDGLGLSEPRIFVEVKHRAGPVGAPAIRSFLGGRRQGDRCLYVSSGGFTQEARYEAERSQIPITLIALPRLRELLVEYYEALDSETRALAPLKKVYWPVRLNDL